MINLHSTNKAEDLEYLDIIYREIEEKHNEERANHPPHQLNCLHNVALLRLALLIPSRSRNVSQFCRTQFCKTLDDLKDDKGIPGDWAFTALNYVLAVHCRLIAEGANNPLYVDEASNLRNYIFKNFAFKLRGMKQICFMTTLFVGLRYDFDEKDELREVISIGKYVLRKYDFKKYRKLYTENRFYFAFVYLFLSEIYTSNSEMHKLEKVQARKHTKQAKVNTSAPSANNLWQFLNETFLIIKHECHRKEMSKERHDKIMDLKCKCRWKKALVSSRLKENVRDGKAVTLWKRHIHLLKSNTTGRAFFNPPPVEDSLHS